MDYTSLYAKSEVIIIINQVHSSHIIDLLKQFYAIHGGKLMSSGYLRENILFYSYLFSQIKQICFSEKAAPSSKFGYSGFIVITSN